MIVNFNRDDHLQFQESLLVLQFNMIALIQHVPHFKYSGRFCTCSICGVVYSDNVGPFILSTNT